ncbi:MAG: FtsX-like permease family protein [Thermoplasmata archaeon]
MGLRVSVGSAGHRGRTTGPPPGPPGERSSLRGSGRTFLRLATRFNWRVGAAMLGIAVCATYATGALVLLDGLEAGSRSVLDRLEAGPYLTYRGVFPRVDPIVRESSLEGPYRAGWLRPAAIVTNSTSVPVRVLALADGTLGGPAPAPGTARGSPRLLQEVGTSLVLRTAQDEIQVNLASSTETTLPFPDSWIVIAETDLRRLATWDEGTFDLLFVEPRGDALLLQGAGYTVLALASAPDFFGATLREARGLVGSLVVVSAVAIAAIAYSLIALEMRYRRRETRTLLALGVDGRGLGRLYGLQLAFIVVGGTLLGMAGGIVAAYALVSFAPLFGLPTVIAPHLSIAGFAVPLAAALAAGLAGGGLSLFQNLRRWNRAPRG